MYGLLTYKLVALKIKNPDPILTVKITEWRKFIDYFGISIEADPYGVKKKRIFCPCWVYSKTFIYKAPYSKATSGQRVQFITNKASFLSRTSGNRGPTVFMTCVS